MTSTQIRKKSSELRLRSSELHFHSSDPHKTTSSAVHSGLDENDISSISMPTAEEEIDTKVGDEDA